MVRARGTSKRSIATAFVDSVRELFRNLAAHGAPTTAAAMAFHFFLSLIPLLVLGGAILGLLVRQRGVDTMMEPILETLPLEAAALVRRELEGLGGVSIPVAPLGVIGFVLVASSGTHHVMDVLEVAARAAPRRWWKQRAIALAWNLAMAGALALATWALLKGDRALHRGERAAAQAPRPPAPSNAARGERPPSAAADPAGASPGSSTLAPPRAPSARSPSKGSRTRHAAWERMIASGVLLALAFVGLGVFYRVAVGDVDAADGAARGSARSDAREGRSRASPRAAGSGAPRRSRPVWRGAALAVTAGFLVSYLFGLYAGTLGGYAAYYGSLAAVAVILVWLFLTSYALLMGAELNAAQDR